MPVVFEKAAICVKLPFIRFANMPVSSAILFNLSAASCSISPKKIASKFELEEYYTLDEALKLYALYRMDMDIQNGKADEIRERRD